jgi:hypothetical protein
VAFVEEGGKARVGYGEAVAVAFYGKGEGVGGRLVDMLGFVGCLAFVVELRGGSLGMRVLRRMKR